MDCQGWLNLHGGGSGLEEVVRCGFLRRGFGCCLLGARPFALSARCPGHAAEEVALGAPVCAHAGDDGPCRAVPSGGIGLPHRAGDGPGGVSGHVPGDSVGDGLSD